MPVRTRTWMPLTGLGLIALAGVFIMFGGQSAYDWAERVESDGLASSLDAEATAEVPPGADMPTVVEWFKKRGMGFHYYVGPDPHGPDAAYHGLAPGQVAGSAVGSSGKHHAMIYFFFGKDGRAIKHVVCAIPPAG
jgi:hypothetical protein